MKIPLLFVSSFALISAYLAPLSAVTIVSWGPADDIIATSGTSMTGGSSTALNLSEIRSPAVGPDYYPNNTGKTPEFYGAAIGNFRIRGENPDNIGTSGNSITENAMIVLWTKDLFINNGDSFDVTLSGMSSETEDNSGDNTTINRYVIRLGTDFYVSQTFDEGAASFTDPTTISWFNYDPTSNYTTIGSAASLSDFGNLTAVGIYINTTRVAPGTIQSKMVSLNVDAVVIPEPSWGAFTLISGIALLAYRRRRS